MSNSLLYRIVQLAYNRVLRPHLPATHWVAAGIPVYGSDDDPLAPKIVDIGENVQSYKPELIAAIKKYVGTDDDVGIVGGGRGVDSIVATRQGGDVTAYEAAGEMVEIAKKTIEWQALENKIHFQHAIVGEDVEVYGTDIGEKVSPSSLSHDVLVMDCEGAEKSVIQGLDYLPRVLIVETHPERGMSTKKTEVAIENAGMTLMNATNVEGGPKQIIVAMCDSS